MYLYVIDELLLVGQAGICRWLLLAHPVEGLLHRVQGAAQIG